MSEFSEIRPFHNSEVSEVLKQFKTSEMVHQLLQIGFPKLSNEERIGKLLECQKITDFQVKIMYPIIQGVIDKSVTELSSEGFDNLDKNKAFLFISNHRDIILDTSFLNFKLHDFGHKMTASAVGDNLVKKPLVLAFARLNRNFLIHRGLPPRETLGKSKIVSKFIHRYIIEKKRSVWIAQREGRTKDGNDRTQQGVLKMLSMNCPKGMSVMQYFKTLHIVPTAISYELDPTDAMKMPTLLAQHEGIEYVKTQNEDFNNIVQGFIGQKGRVHLSVGTPLNTELDTIEKEFSHPNRQIQALAELMDEKIYSLYKLFPTNYIAYDLLTDSNHFASQYTEKELRQFERRIANRSTSNNEISRQKFLEMYANPVRNKYKI